MCTCTNSDLAYDYQDRKRSLHDSILQHGFSWPQQERGDACGEMQFLNAIFRQTGVAILEGGTCAHRCTDAKLSLLSTEMPQTWSMLSVQFDWLSRELLVDMY